MKAILVTVEITTRIIVPDDFNVEDQSDHDYQILMDKGLPKLLNNLRHDGIGDYLTELREDAECPYEEGEEETAKFYINN